MGGKKDRQMHVLSHAWNLGFCLKMKVMRNKEEEKKSGGRDGRRRKSDRLKRNVQ